MITHTKLQIEINGKTAPGCISFVLTQVMHGHHFFRAEFSGTSQEKDPSSLAAESIKLAGAGIKVQLSNNKGEGSVFKGIITSVHSTGSNQAGYSQHIVYEGYSPTILLDKGPSSFAFSEMKLKDIINSVSKEATGNMLSLNLSPRHSAKLLYTVQYNESAFAFINRLARRYGEWCYYDGLEMVIGHKKQNEVTLKYGSKLLNFDFAMQTAPIHRNYAAYGYKNSENLDKKTKKSDSTIDGPSAMALSASDKTWKAPEPMFLHLFNEEEALPQQLDELNKLNIQSSAARLVTFKGTSTHTALFPGAIINVESVGDEAPKNFGKYIITSIQHHYQMGGQYQNNFEASPLEVEVSPFTNTSLIPQCGSMPGIVTDNKDPLGLGRIKVKLCWQKDGATPWIRMAVPYSGADKGMYFIPETGEEVMVGFENGNAEKPFVIGSLYHGKATAESFKNQDNDIKAIKTRGGHLIEFNDKDGNESITISDKNGNTIKLDTKGKSIEITASEDITLTAKNITLNADTAINLAAQQEVSIASSSGDVKVTAGANLEAKANAMANMEGTNLGLKASGIAKLEGTMVNIN